MNFVKLSLRLTVLLAAASLGGWQAQASPFSSPNPQGNAEKFVLFGRLTQPAITCAGLRENVREDGRLRVVANWRNHEFHDRQVQIRCVFKDAAGFSTGGETSWQTLILGEGVADAMRFLASHAEARHYTLVVRQAC